ncbi:hypothetical protein B0I33_107116 [Prauserella shujinwangii]|uniref:Uncharacterized protein n=1 Tax=Prauserella shujinwangii TaxID=1453103 RepID=A0A2T0LS90_9PSEU|nr:hypothetical protein [Prauserella shujinwangii]PRX46539.1 hypothetical protein B0I33_107116 [Prauserella shujinwangii]
MSGPAPFGDADQERLLRLLHDELRRSLPAGWEYAQVKHRAIGRHAETAAIVQSVAGPLLPWRAPERVTELFGELRAASATSDGGTWLSAVLELRQSGGFRARFDGTGEPDFRAGPPPEAFAEELRLFPRAEEHVPGWLRRRADEAGEGR